MRERRDVLGNAERIATALGTARGALEDERGAVDALGDAVHALGALTRYGEPFASLSAAAGALQADVTTLAADLTRAAADVEQNPAELETIVARLDAIESLKKKYGGSIAAVFAARTAFAATIDADLGRDERLATIDAEIVRLDATIDKLATQLHAMRVKAASACEGRIAEELRALAMPAAHFTIAIEPLETVTAHGRDKIEFRFSANPGEPERALGKVASGGEKSRVLLALVVALADQREARAFVFDEIDAGIGGATAVAVGGRLGRLARTSQVVSVTHLAQIAAVADAHYTLRKHEEDGITTIDVLPLAAGDARLSEIARMLSGETSAISLEHAGALIAAARG